MMPQKSIRMVTGDTRYLFGIELGHTILWSLWPLSEFYLLQIDYFQFRDDLSEALSTMSETVAQSFSLRRTIHFISKYVEHAEVCDSEINMFEVIFHLKTIVLYIFKIFVYSLSYPREQHIEDMAAKKVYN